MSNDARTRVLVVCPTEYGGQIEHAADTAMALAVDPRVESVVLLSRPGADAYLGRPAVEGLTVVETVPPRRTGGFGPLRQGLQVLDLIREHAQIRRLSRLAGPGTVLALDSSKYPWPGLLTARRDQRTALFLHNVKPHHDENAASLRERVLRYLELGAARGVDRVIVHGEDQKRTARATVPGDLVAVTLPTSTRIDQAATAESVPVDVPGETGTDSTAAARTGRGLTSATAEPYALVLGELRANKGVELAIDAAGQAGVPLLVAGRPESAELGQLLHDRARAAGSVEILDRFLERSEFTQLLEGAAVVVLPYTHFDAQSGILAKAVAAGLPIVASDLPSLKEQAGSHEPALFADVRDTAAFAAALRQGFDDAVARGTRAAAVTQAEHADWAPTVDAVLGTVPTARGTGRTTGSGR
ncbi:glycosyltransferase family 4 protein [Kocuria sp. JC486]|uniref:glycosyltransferase family 4 protein n=1 Tax=Kocuria sp. JC486 TaxID=1970736 RepID=UPI0032AF3377